MKARCSRCRPPRKIETETKVPLAQLEGLSPELVAMLDQARYTTLKDVIDLEAEEIARIPGMTPGDDRGTGRFLERADRRRARRRRCRVPEHEPTARPDRPGRARWTGAPGVDVTRAWVRQGKCCVVVVASDASQRSRDKVVRVASEPGFRCSRARRRDTGRPAWPPAGHGGRSAGPGAGDRESWLRRAG